MVMQLWRVSRPGIVSMRQVVCARRAMVSGRPISSVQRCRLWAIAAITVQAALALNWPDGARLGNVTGFV